MLTSTTLQCETRWQLYISWLTSSPADHEQRLAEYSQHLATCVVCKNELASHREGQSNPELTDDQVENA